MKRYVSGIGLFIFFLLNNTKAAQTPYESRPLWKAGTAKCVITPKNDMWMAGYATRNKPSSGKIHDLWAKALVLEDQQANQLVFVTTDLLGIPKNIAQAITTKLGEAYGLPRANIVLNSSHTHSGPVLEGALTDIYAIDRNEKKKIEAYSSWLTNQIVNIVKQALEHREEAFVYAGSGFSTFQVNRRNNREKELRQLTELKGPNDYSVPVIKVMSAKGQMRALMFSYACHATVLDGYEWSGDYVGFAQLELESLYKGCQAMFVQGAGADQNPLPRKSVALARQYGKVLSAAVEQVIADDKFQLLAPNLKTAYVEVQLPLEKSNDKAYFKSVLEDQDTPNYFLKWAKRMLEKIDAGEKLDTSYPYPVQSILIGDQAIFALGGELVVQYALDLKKEFGNNVMVFGYCNDVMAYIPSERILAEGGYEGDDSQKVYGLPAKWQKGIEQKIIDACKQLYVNKH